MTETHRPGVLWLLVSFGKESWTFDFPCQRQKVVAIGDSDECPVRVSGLPPIAFHIERDGHSLMLIRGYPRDLRLNAKRVAQAASFSDKGVVEFGKYRFVLHVLDRKPAVVSPRRSTWSYPKRSDSAVHEVETRIVPSLGPSGDDLIPTENEGLLKITEETGFELTQVMGSMPDADVWGPGCAPSLDAVSEAKSFHPRRNARFLPRVEHNHAGGSGGVRNTHHRVSGERAFEGREVRSGPVVDTLPEGVPLCDFTLSGECAGTKGAPTDELETQQQHVVPGRATIASRVRTLACLPARALFEGVQAFHRLGILMQTRPLFTVLASVLGAMSIPLALLGIERGFNATTAGSLPQIFSPKPENAAPKKFFRLSLEAQDDSGTGLAGVALSVNGTELGITEASGRLHVSLPADPGASLLVNARYPKPAATTASSSVFPPAKETDVALSKGRGAPCRSGEALCPSSPRVDEKSSYP